MFPLQWFLLSPFFCILGNENILHTSHGKFMQKKNSLTILLLKLPSA